MLLGEQVLLIKSNLNQLTYNKELKIFKY